MNFLIYSVVYVLLQRVKQYCVLSKWLSLHLSCCFEYHNTRAEDIMFSVRTKVNFYETDAMAVVHHANYFRWFEMGRVEFLRKAGITLNELMAKGIVFPITEVSCKYKASAKFDDWIVIEVTPTALTPVKMAFTYQVFREADHTLLAEGTTQNLFTNMEGKIIRLEAEYVEKLKKIAEL